MKCLLEVYGERAVATPDWKCERKEDDQANRPFSIMCKVIRFCCFCYCLCSERITFVSSSKVSHCFYVYVAQIR